MAAYLLIGLAFLLLIDRCFLMTNEIEDSPQPFGMREYIAEFKQLKYPFLGAVFASYWLGVVEWMNPSLSPPFTGKYSWISSSLYHAFGAKGNAVAFMFFSAFLLIILICIRRKIQK